MKKYKIEFEYLGIKRRLICVASLRYRALKAENFSFISRMPFGR